MCLLSLLAVAVAFAADTLPRVFDDVTRTLHAYANGDVMSEPLAMLGSADRIFVDFDRIGDDREYFRYSLTHCNADWQPSGLAESEFLDGFNEGVVDNYDFSHGTTVHYVHYCLAVPNEEISPAVSGNYLLTVYPEDDPDSPVLQCRFMMCEDTAPVRVAVSSQTDVDYNKSHQQVSVMVDTEHARVEDIFNDLIVKVNQNGRRDNEVTVRQPLRVSGRRSFYEHAMPLIFDAGNEYRRFETVSSDYPGMGVEDIDYFRPYYHYTLYTDRTRAGQEYEYDRTQAGGFMVRRTESRDNDTEADYGVVHFTLEYPYSHQADIFLDGDFVLRRFDSNSRMTYNPATGLYERSLLLKQGSYNYQYLLLPPGAKRAVTAPIEGDKYQTLNRYTVRVYHRRRGERYDRLIGTGSTYNSL